MTDVHRIHISHSFAPYVSWGKALSYKEVASSIPSGERERGGTGVDGKKGFGLRWLNSEPLLIFMAFAADTLFCTSLSLHCVATAPGMALHLVTARAGFPA